MELIPFLVSFLSYRVAAFCLFTVPLTHGLMLRAYGAGQYIVFPLTGGRRHAVFQVLGWAFWGLSGLLTVPVVLRLTGSDDPVPATHVDVVSGTAAVCGVIAELFILKAILAYEAECQQAGRALRKLRSGSGTRTATPCKGSGGGGSPGASPATTVPRTRSSSNAATLRKSLLRADGGVANSTASASAKATVVATAGDNDTTAGAAETRRMGEEETEDDGSCSDLDAEEEEDEGGGADDNAMPPALFSPRAASAAVIVMGLTLAATGFFLLMAVEYMPDLPSRLLYCCLSLTCLVIGASCTHGLGGHLAYAKNARGGKSAWSFFQPFAGGTAFVATQAVGWSLFACTLVYLVVFLQLLVRGLAYCVRCWALGAGVMMFATQLCLGVSLLTWRGTVSAKKLVQLSKGGASLAGTLLPVLMLYLPVHAFFGVWAASFALLPFRWATAAWLSFAVPYVAFTFAGAPQETGWRTWPSLQAWVSSNLEASLTFFFGHVEVLKDGAEPLDPAHKYIFGFAPHGLYPTGAGLLPNLPSFHAQFPGIRPITLTASVVHFVPGMRDVCAWGGMRVVSRHSFVRALHDHGSVVICPGGQAELVHTFRAFKNPTPEIVIYGRHKGFVRLAIEQQARLVPVLAVGETLQFRNLVDIPWLQQWSYKRLGFPMPFLPAGRWGGPLPRRVPLKYIVGKPLAPPPLPLHHHHHDGQPVPQSAVDDLHRRFYDSLIALFEKYASTHPEYVNARVVVIE